MAGLVDRLDALLGSSAVSVDADRRRTASRDQAWLSPVLRRRLPDRVADVVVSPADTAGVARVLAVAHEWGIPVTPRGRGTGNYGQAIPLAGGIVVDADRRGRVLDVGTGWVRAEAGVSFVRLEAAARRTGQELAMFPSTVTSALGGFLAGGAGGSGSIAHGFVWDGFVLANTLRDELAVSGQRLLAVSGQSPMAAHSGSARYPGKERLYAGGCERVRGDS